MASTFIQYSIFPRHAEGMDGSKRSRGGGQIRIGISGWRCPPWRGVFYPQELVQRRELEFASHRFPTIEFSGSLHWLQAPKGW